MNIPAALNELVAALTEHAKVMSGQEVAPERAVDVVERVRVAAARYSDATFESSGWGSPFSDLFEDEEQVEGTDENESGGGSVSGDAERISITGRWDFVVTDQEEWFAHVTQALHDLGAGDCAVELSSAAQAMHELLTHDDPFRGYTRHGLADGGQDWMIEQVPKTLSETPDEEYRD
ncbi:hypothetical protein AB0M97_25455 [Streptomyces sp. NPDC051207]|uniref:hypothetical protein n=1 Tax=Streptomyces sp. NPDC051207 TaxID=3154641 RepID=UPI003412B85C